MLALLAASLVVPSDLPASYSDLRAHVRAASYSWNEEQTLLDLLRDPDPTVRRQAVRSLKAYVPQRSSTRDKVVDVLRDPGEELSVRREAVKTLSVVSGDSSIQRLLLDTAERSSERALRVIAYKSLHWAAAQGWSVRDELLDAARRESDAEVRRAAIWGLFQCSGDDRVQDVLLDIARRDPDTQTRDAALRSLYHGMGDSDVRRVSEDLAEDAGEPRAVRVTATLLNSFRVESRQTELLEELAERDSDPAVRRAAVIALGSGASDEISAHFHLVRRGRDGRVVQDPLDAE